MRIKDSLAWSGLVSPLSPSLLYTLFLLLLLLHRLGLDCVDVDNWLCCYYCFFTSIKGSYHQQGKRGEKRKGKKTKREKRFSLGIKETESSPSIRALGRISQTRPTTLRLYTSCCCCSTTTSFCTTAEKKEKNNNNNKKKRRRWKRKDKNLIGFSKDKQPAFSLQFSLPVSG